MSKRPREYLKRLRAEKDWSQTKAAEEIGIGQTYYGYIELGERQKDMSYSMMERLAKAFNVPVQFIIDEEAKYQKAWQCTE